MKSIEFAKNAGALVLATASGRNREFLLGLGADEFIDYTSQNPADVAGGAADVVFDTVGVGETLVPVVREGGVIVTIASAPPEDGAKARGARADLLVANTNTEQLERIAQLVDGGQVHVEIAETLPLSEVRRAHELSESGHVRGKLVLAVAG